MKLPDKFVGRGFSRRDIQRVEKQGLDSLKSY